MSGGVAYVLDADGRFATQCCNLEMVELEAVTTADDIEALRRLIQQHQTITASSLAARILEDWESFHPRFVKVMPVEYKQALEKLAVAERAAV
jgi:glutamate synthase domain-containing protein 3